MQADAVHEGSCFTRGLVRSALLDEPRERRRHAGGGRESVGEEQAARLGIPPIGHRRRHLTDPVQIYLHPFLSCSYSHAMLKYDPEPAYCIAVDKIEALVLIYIVCKCARRTIC